MLTGEDESLLIGWDPFFVLDLSLNIVDGISGFNFEGDSLSSQSLDEDLHTSTKTKYEMESGLFLRDGKSGEIGGRVVEEQLATCFA